MNRWILLAAVMMAPLPALAQEAREPGRPPQRIRNVQLVGDEKCPPAVGDEIVVCGLLDPSEVYRIPEELRETPANPANTAWAVRAEQMMEDNRAGLPDSCSPVGTGGQSGCTAQFLNNWRAQQREQQRRDNLVP
ncbi:hypothetical protein [Sphingomonas sp. 37zxx]|uniref:hypothetical protein n=1 Tax=Sphingomonas sp. 37zxx TaxID=1550073 RepID=UPI00053BEAD9|nr:hypothetical protein [Sphingomonas sp. 37zxx]